MDGDLISRQYLLDKFSRNSIYEHITNSEGKSVVDIVREAPTILDLDEINTNNDLISRRELLECWKDLQQRYGNLAKISTFIYCVENFQMARVVKMAIRKIDKIKLLDVITAIGEHHDSL